MATKNKFVPRVNQVDSIYLNKEITRLIREDLLDNLHALSPIFVNIKPELDLLIQSAIWIGSVGKQCSSFGQQLLVLAYDSEKFTISRMCIHFVLTVLPRYIKSIDEQRLSRRNEWLHKAIEWIENVALALSVLNFFRFLKTGRKPTLIDYLLSLDYISLRNNQRRDIGYKYLTRELLWGGFMEMLGLVLPIINFRKIQRLFKSTILSASARVADGKNQTTRKISVPKMTLHTTCVYCSERPTLPHHMDCGHIYCFYCLSANFCTDSNFACIACGAHASNGIHLL